MDDKYSKMDGPELVATATAKGINPRGMSRDELISTLNEFGDSPELIEYKEGIGITKLTQRVVDLEKDVEALKSALSMYADKKVKEKKVDEKVKEKKNG